MPAYGSAIARGYRENITRRRLLRDARAEIVKLKKEIQRLKLERQCTTRPVRAP